MPLTPVQSGRLGVRLISITGSSSPAHVGVALADRRVRGQIDDAFVIVGNLQLELRHSMPRLSTPRILPTPSVMFLPGMNEPGGENTPIIPARALGAPQTTCTGSPLPVSTMHTRSRSAFGCCSAETTRAMVNGASALRLVLDPLDLEPDHGELVDDRGRAARRSSRCSLSQARVNFTNSVLRRASGSRAAGSRSARASARRPRRTHADRTCRT